MHAQGTDQCSYYNNPCLEGVLKVTHLIFFHVSGMEPITVDTVSGNGEEMSFQTNVHILGWGTEIALSHGDKND